jgi:hypothetical protein
MDVRYYNLGRKSPRYLKNKVLRHSVKGLKKPVLESNSITKIPAMSSKHFHHGCLNGLTTYLYEMAILLLL